MVIDTGIVKNNRIIPFLCFNFKPETGMRLPKTGVRFYFLLWLGVEGGEVENSTSIKIDR